MLQIISESSFHLPLSLAILRNSSMLCYGRFYWPVLIVITRLTSHIHHCCCSDLKIICKLKVIRPLTSWTDVLSFSEVPFSCSYCSFIEDSSCFKWSVSYSETYINNHLQRWYAASRVFFLSALQDASTNISVRLNLISRWYRTETLLGTASQKIMWKCECLALNRPYRVDHCVICILPLWNRPLCNMYTTV